MCNSLSEMNSAFQFALGRSSVHSEGCHHIRLLQPRVNAVRRILHSGMPNDDKLGSTKFQDQLLLSNFAFGSHALNMANLFVLEKTQIPSFVMLWGKSECPQKFKPRVHSRSAKTKTDSFASKSLLYRLYYRCQKGLRGVHSDKSVANIFNLRQWRSQQRDDGIGQ